MQLTPPRWVIAELDVNGEIDEHAAMCLRYGFEDALAIRPAMILVDLRELTEIAAAGLALFVGQDADCRARDTQLASSSAPMRASSASSAPSPTPGSAIGCSSRTRLARPSR
jgi:anti-anti-sigma regulatory factor